MVLYGTLLCTPIFGSKKKNLHLSLGKAGPFTLESKLKDIESKLKSIESKLI